MSVGKRILDTNIVSYLMKGGALARWRVREVFQGSTANDERDKLSPQRRQFVFLLKLVNTSPARRAAQPNHHSERR